MVAYPLGTIRIVRQFVFRKRIGDEVKFFQVCCWKEECVRKQDWDGLDIFRINQMVPVCFVPEKEYNSMTDYSYGLGS